MAIKELKVLNQRLYEITQAIADAIVPQGGAFEIGAKDIDTALIFDHYIDRMSKLQLKFIKYIIYMFEYSPMFTKLKRFTKMSSNERLDYLKGWENSKLSSKRQILIMMKLLLMMCFYSNKAAQDAIGYHESIGDHPDCLIKI